MAMKESGIEWVGLIPDTWSVIPNKYVMHKEKNLCEKWTGEDVMSLTMNGVIVRDLQNPTGKMPATFDGYQYIEDGDLLMCLFDIDVTPRCVGKVTHNGVTSPAYSNFKVHDNASRDYFYYYYLMVDNTKELLHLAKNLRHSFTEEQLGQLKVPMPPLSEQQAIADYLDETCSKIDEIIAKAKASIDEYKELKQSVIFEAVTKGLDKNVEMKDSGYDFIGCIPSEWEMCKVRHLGTAQNGISIGGDAFGSGHPFVSYGDVYKNYSLPKVVDKLVQSSEEDRKRYSVEKGDWFFTRTSETIEEVGFSCVCEETIPDAVFAGFLIRVRPFNNRIYTGFAKYYFRSNHLRTFFVKEMNLVTRASLAQGLLKDAPVVVPPYDEQIEIANYLENKCEIIDGVIKDKESTINDLEAYKKSLIYEVVTGKRRVV